jgi:hypothetical protein
LRPVVPDIRQGKANHLAGLELPVFPEHGYILLSRDSVKKFMPKEKKQEGGHVTFEHPLPAHMMAIDGT